MRALQRKFRGFAVVETDRGPLFRSVTRLAFGSVAAAVRILRFVTIDARAGQVFISFAGVADGALHLFMSPFEREFCFGVIEGPRLTPGVLAVTARTIFAKLAVVRLVLLMASNTG